MLDLLTMASRFNIKSTFTDICKELQLHLFRDICITIRDMMMQISLLKLDISNSIADICKRTYTATDAQKASKEL